MVCAFSNGKSDRCPNSYYGTFRQYGRNKKRNGKKIMRLLIIEFHKYIVAFDKQDQMISYYPSERKSI